MNPAPTYLIFFAPLLFIPMFALITGILSRLGWSDLAKHYKYEEDFTGERIGLISAAINKVNYNNCLVLRADSFGFHLKPILLFRAFHPPIFIPWDQVKEVNHKKVLFTSMTELVIGSPKVASINLRPKTFFQLQTVNPNLK